MMRSAISHPGNCDPKKLRSQEIAIPRNCDPHPKSTKMRSEKYYYNAILTFLDRILGRYGSHFSSFVDHILVLFGSHFGTFRIAF